MSFATPDELAEHLGETFDADDTTSAQRLLDSATSKIRGHVDQHLSQVADDVVTLDGDGRRRLLLPEIPVTAVTSVVEDGTALVVDDDYRWSDSGILTRVGECWPDEPRSVVVTYTHGWAADSRQLDQLRDLCIDVAARAWSNPEGVRTRSIDHVTIGWEAGAAGVALTDDEKDDLTRLAAGR